MNDLIVKMVIMLTLPIVVFLTGAWGMSKMCDQHYLIQRVMQLPDPDRIPLNQRFGGYNASSVKRYWAALDEAAYRAERCSLKLDLLFPILYGAALLSSLLMAWTTLGKPFYRAWLMAPLAVTILADWTENLVQLGQLGLHIEGGEVGLQLGWIQVASTATVLKLAFFTGTTLFLVCLVVGVIIRAIKSP